jgi:eukaryotic-like serine/threonine-protein kinase
MATEAQDTAARPGARLAPGTVLADRYQLESILGAGSFGVVWRARHVHLRTEHAVKLFDPLPGANHRDTRARFLLEARVTAHLRSAHLARVSDYGLHGEMPFLVMELLHGISLRGRIDEQAARRQALAPAEAARIVRHIAEALGAAHAAGVVHRDLKPENVFLADQAGYSIAKVLDFGIAKWSIDDSARVTATHTVMGTPHYMSPEQFGSARDVDQRADLWSLGVIAFECLTGQVPFPGNTLIDVAFKVCKEGPLVASQIANVPAGFDAWFARATALGPQHRFSSALEMADALEQICVPQASVERSSLPPSTAAPLAPEASPGDSHSGGDTPAPAVNDSLRRPTGARRRRSLLALGLGATFALVALASALSPSPPEGDAVATGSEGRRQAPLEQRVNVDAGVVTPSDPARLQAAEERAGPGDSPSLAPATGATTMGSLDSSAIQLTVQRYRSSLSRGCWQPAMSARAPGAPVNVQLSVEISVEPSGHVDAVSGTDPSGYPGLVRCIQSRILGWRFPQASAATRASVTLAFSEADGAPASAPSKRADCAEPYWVDSSGIRRLKADCR